MAIAYRGAKTIVASPKVRKAPGSFSQSVRVGDWLLLAGQDAVGFNREVDAEGDLAGQTEVTLQHTKDILEEAGGTLDDLVKTTVYLIAGQERSEFAAAYRKFFNRHSRSSKDAHGVDTGSSIAFTAVSSGDRCRGDIWGISLPAGIVELLSVKRSIKPTVMPNDPPRKVPFFLSIPGSCTSGQKYRVWSQQT